MPVPKYIKSGKHDVYRSFLVKTAKYDGELELPCIAQEDRVPNRLISFSKALRSKDYDQWVHFYENDIEFERIWNHLNTYLPILKKFSGVISPDFSLYRDMPLVMQQWNTYRNRAIAHWLQEHNLHVIPNVRFGDERTYSFCCNSIPRYSIIAIGSHGCIKVKREREYFQKGLSFVVNSIHPKIIIIYGTAPDSLFAQYVQKGIIIKQFDSEFAQSRNVVIT